MYSELGVEQFQQSLIGRVRHLLTLFAESCSVTTTGNILIMKFCTDGYDVESGFIGRYRATTLDDSELNNEPMSGFETQKGLQQNANCYLETLSFRPHNAKRIFEQLQQRTR